MPTKTKASEYRNNAATAERSEYQNEETESKAEYPSEDRDNSYLAANQHMVKFTDELRSINEQAALDFDRRKNPAEYDQKEKQEMLEAVTEAFNAAKWNSANERLDAAHQVSQNLYQPMYSRIEVAEAAAQHRLPAGFIDEVRKEKIDYFEKRQDAETGAERLELTVKDLETAQRMVEESNGMFYLVSTRNLDHYQSQFANALYNSDTQENAKQMMEGSLDNAVRYYNGDISHVRRWDELLEGNTRFWENEQEGSDKKQADGESDQKQTEGESDQKQAEGKSDQEQTEGESDQKQAEGKSDQEQTEGESDQKQAEGKSDQEQTEGKSDQKQAEAESDQKQAEGEAAEQLEPSYQELAAFRNLESMDEYTLDHEVNDILHERLGHSQEYVAELQLSQHPDAKAVARVHEAIHEMAHEGIVDSVNQGNEENFSQAVRNIERWDRRLAEEMREATGFIQGENYKQPNPPEDFSHLGDLSDYAEEVRAQNNANRHNMSDLNYDVTSKLVEKLEKELQMSEQWGTSESTYDTSEAYRAMDEIIQAMEYTTRPEDPMFWKLRGMNKERAESEIQAMTENRASEGAKEWMENNESLKARERALLGLEALKKNTRDDVSHAIDHRDYELYRYRLDDIEHNAGEYAEIFGTGSQEVWVDEKLESPVKFTEIETEDLEEKKRLYLDQSMEFNKKYERAVQGAVGGDTEAATYLTEELRHYHQIMLEGADSHDRDSDQDFKRTDDIAEMMASLLHER